MVVGPYTERPDVGGACNSSVAYGTDGLSGTPSGYMDAALLGFELLRVLFLPVLETWDGWSHLCGVVDTKGLAVVTMSVSVDPACVYLGYVGCAGTSSILDEEGFVTDGACYAVKRSVDCDDCLVRRAAGELLLSCCSGDAACAGCCGLSLGESAACGT